jgi:uncharacterized protein YodC (DUF2158 family)
LSALSYVRWRCIGRVSRPRSGDNAPVQDMVQFEAGDVVRLKAGGPPMVIRAVSGDSAYCQWYSGVDLHQGTFLFSSLEDISRHRRSPGALTHTGAVAGPLRP